MRSGLANHLVVNCNVKDGILIWLIQPAGDVTPQEGLPLQGGHFLGPSPGPFYRHCF
jgi:hypothetical protein